jgi:uncharacterized protein (TIGR02678 family)
VFGTVVRNREALVTWFSDHTGWRLLVQPAAGFARLYKVPTRPDPFHPAGLAGKSPFDRRRYALLCLILASLDESPGQTTLRRLVGLLEDLTRGDPEIEPFEARSFSERRAFVDVLRWLDETGVLRSLDGDSERYTRDEKADALYDVDEALLGQLLAAPVPPALAGSPERLGAEPYAETDDGERLQARHRVMRAVLDAPVIYYDDLTPRELDWLTHARGFMYRLLEDDVGFQVERRKEGLAAIDPEGKTTDTLFPDGGSTVKHAALLLAEQLTALLKREKRHVFSEQEIVAVISDLMTDYGEQCHWSQQYSGGRDGPRALAHDAMALLAQFCLFQQGDDGRYQLRPAIARFAPAAPTSSE